MKKNSRKKATRKPEVGAYYRTSPIGIIKVLSIDESKNQAVYTIMGSKITKIWDYESYPDCLDRPLSPLEVELL